MPHTGEIQYEAHSSNVVSLFTSEIQTSLSDACHLY